MTLKPPKQFLRYLAVLLFSGGVALLTLGCIMIGRVRLPLPTDKSIDKRDQSSGWGHSGHPWGGDGDQGRRAGDSDFRLSGRRCPATTYAPSLWPCQIT